MGARHAVRYGHAIATQAGPRRLSDIGLPMAEILVGVDGGPFREVAERLRRAKALARLVELGEPGTLPANASTATTSERSGVC
jgi:hypothetical protein